MTRRADPAATGPMTTTEAWLTDATQGVLELVEQIPAGAWDRAGLGDWTLRELVAHTGRSWTLLGTYLAEPIPDAVGVGAGPRGGVRRALGRILPHRASRSRPLPGAHCRAGPRRHDTGQALPALGFHRVLPPHPRMVGAGQGHDDDALRVATPLSHSHSMVPGGLLVTSTTTRLISRTSLVIRVLIFSSRS